MNPELALNFDLGSKLTLKNSPTSHHWMNCNDSWRLLASHSHSATIQRGLPNKNDSLVQEASN